VFHRELPHGSKVTFHKPTALGYGVGCKFTSSSKKNIPLQINGPYCIIRRKQCSRRKGVLPVASWKAKAVQPFNSRFSSKDTIENILIFKGGPDAAIILVVKGTGSVIDDN